MFIAPALIVTLSPVAATVLASMVCLSTLPEPPITPPLKTLPYPLTLLMLLAEITTPSLPLIVNVLLASLDHSDASALFVGTEPTTARTELSIDVFVSSPAPANTPPDPAVARDINSGALLAATSTDFAVTLPEPPK